MLKKFTPPDFILIPYQLLEDKDISLVDERVYGIIYWLTKLKGEKCSASNRYLANAAKTKQMVVANSLTKLEKKGFIKRIFKDNDRKIRAEIVPLLMFNKVSLTNDTISLRNDRGVSLTNEQNNKRYKEEKQNNTLENEAFSDKDRKKLISLFKEVNPSYEVLFTRKSQTQALKRMCKIYGYEKLEDMIKALPIVNANKYWPKSTTPCQLENNIPIYKAKNDENKGQNNKLNVIKI